MDIFSFSFLDSEYQHFFFFFFGGGGGQFSEQNVITPLILAVETKSPLFLRSPCIHARIAGWYFLLILAPAESLGGAQYFIPYIFREIKIKKNWMDLVQLTWNPPPPLAPPPKNGLCFFFHHCFIVLFQFLDIIFTLKVKKNVKTGLGPKPPHPTPPPPPPPPHYGLSPSKCFFVLFLTSLIWEWESDFNCVSRFTEHDFFSRIWFNCVGLVTMEERSETWWRSVWHQQCCPTCPSRRPTHWKWK